MNYLAISVIIVILFIAYTFLPGNIFEGTVLLFRELITNLSVDLGWVFDILYILLRIGIVVIVIKMLI